MIVPSLIATQSFSGAITSATSTALSLAGTPLTANQFNEVDNVAAYYVEITSPGANQGVILDIESNTSSQITLSTDISLLSLTGNESISIRKHSTISSVFADSEAILSPFSDSVTVYERDGSSKTFFYIGEGAWSSDFATPDGSNRPISPATGVLFDTAAPIDLTITGEVKYSPTVVQIAGSGVVNLVGPMNPLFGSGALISSLGFQNMAPFSDSITTYSLGNLATPLNTYFADGEGNVTSDFVTPSTDIFSFSTAALYSAADDISIRLSSGL